MPLPEQIAVQYSEEVAGYMSVRPVVKQVFYLRELADLLVSATGKNIEQVRRILLNGSLPYNGYKYWWNPLPSEPNEIQSLLNDFPDDDPARPFDPGAATAALFEISGGAQRRVTEITRQEASRKKLFARQSPWDVLMAAAAKLPPRYEKYSYAKKADLFRSSLPYENSKILLSALLVSAPRSLRRHCSSLRPPAAIAFVLPR